MTLHQRRVKRDSAVAMARNYAKVDRYDMVQIWVQRADKVLPVTTIQLWGLKNILGPYKFEELGFDELLTEGGL